MGCSVSIKRVPKTPVVRMFPLTSFKNVEPCISCGRPLGSTISIKNHRCSNCHKFFEIDVPLWCDNALLPADLKAEVGAWAQKQGAVSVQDLSPQETFNKLASDIGLKSCQAQRLMVEFELGHYNIGPEKYSASTRHRRTSEGPKTVSSFVGSLSSVTPSSSSTSWINNRLGDGPSFRHVKAEGPRRPGRIVLVRHGQSEANVDRSITQHVPDHELHLTIKGRQQAGTAGKKLEKLLGKDLAKVAFIVSPYVRTRETLNGMLWEWPQNRQETRVITDVRVREQEFGNFDRDDMVKLHTEKKKFGPFYYRFPDGESPADCFDRAAMFLDNLLNVWDTTLHTCVVVSHGMMISVMLMVLLGSPVEDFDHLIPIQNCEFVVLEGNEDKTGYKVAYKWQNDAEKDFNGVSSAKVKDGPVVWDGNPESALIISSNSGTFGNGAAP